MENSKTYKNYYFKYEFSDKGMYMSGCKLPDPNKGPYHFINCDMHSAIRDIIKTQYTTSVIE